MKKGDVVVSVRTSEYGGPNGPGLVEGETGVVTRAYTNGGYKYVDVQLLRGPAIIGAIPVRFDRLTQSN